MNAEPPPADNGRKRGRAVLHLVPRGATATVDESFQQFTAIFQQHRRVVFVTARRICGEELAVDVTQEVFLKLWRAPKQFDAMRGSMRSFLVTMTRGTAIDVLRQHTARRAREERVSDRENLPIIDHGEGMSRREVGRRVVEALSHLDPGERDAIVLAFYDHKTYRDVAVELGIPEGSAKSRIRRGLKRLHAELEDIDPRSSRGDRDD